MVGNFNGRFYQTEPLLCVGWFISTKFNLKTKMTTTQFLITHLIPFALVFIVMGLNEYRLYKNGSIDYKSFTNGIAMLLMSLLTFMLCQDLLSKW